MSKPTKIDTNNMTRVVKPNSWTANFTLVYDAWNRLVIVKDGATTVVTYFYDGLNRRVKKVTASETRGFWYNRNWQCVEERIGSFALLHIRYLWGLRYVDDKVFRERDNKAEPNGSINERLYAIADPNWNIVAMGANVGTPHERFTYNAFGKVNCFGSTFGSKAAPTYTTRTFTGQVLDSETGLMLYRNRVYHPTLGRFMQRDPIGYSAGDVNLVRYVGNRAQVNLDSLGKVKIATNPPAKVIWGTSDFIHHYWFGGGKPVDLGRVGLLTTLLNNQGIKDAIYSAKLDIIIKLMKELKKDCPTSSSISGQWNVEADALFGVRSLFGRPNPLDPMFVVGGTNFEINYTCEGSMECKCNNDGREVVTRFSGLCSFGYHLKDRFENPLDWNGPYYKQDFNAYKKCIKNCGDNFKRLGRIARFMGSAKAKLWECLIICEKHYPLSELPGATPYDITASWSDSVSWNTADESISVSVQK